ncbi:MAG: endonuclease [Actinomycetota bacterium]
MSKNDTVRRLLDQAGDTYAEQAGITLADKPMPLFQLLVLCMLASKPIDANIATKAAKEIFSEKLRTPEAVLDAKRETMIHAFGRAGYARYDESSAPRLTQIATAVKETYHGDLRGLAERSEHDVGTAKKLLEEFTGIGDTGADIFLRESQDVWTWVRPYFDERALAAAKDLGLPADPEALADLAGSACAPLAAALVRVSLDRTLRDAVTSAE